jgi:hypothetical protein
MEPVSTSIGLAATVAVGFLAAMYSGKAALSTRAIVRPPPPPHQGNRKVSTQDATLDAAAAGSYDWAHGACDRLEPFLISHVVGQELALHQFADAACDHIAKDAPQKPLVVSAHGPPGVGKSMMHWMAARALYSRTPERDDRCPGPDCGGYKASDPFPCPGPLLYLWITHDHAWRQSLHSLSLTGAKIWLAQLGIYPTHVTGRHLAG